MTTLEPVPTPTPRQEAARTLNQLRAALDAAGIVIPSLDLDGASLYAADHGTDMRPLIHLGNVNLATARQLAQAITPGAIDGPAS